MATLLEQLAGARGSRKRLPVQQPARAHEQAFAGALVAHMSRAISAAMHPIAHALSPHVRRLDSLRGHIANARDVLGMAIGDSAVIGAVRKHALEVSAYQRVQLGRQLTAATGAQFVLSDEHDVLLAFVDAVMAGLEGIADKLIADARSIAAGAAHNGASPAQVVASIGHKADVAARAAGVIAQRETRRLMSRLNTNRQKALGLESFTWRAQPGSRHAALDGKVYRFDSPPAAGVPGTEHGCECYAQPVV